VNGFVSLDTASPVPPFEQIRSRVAELIVSGALAGGQRLPAVRQLAGDLRSAGPRLVRLAMTAWDDTRDGAVFRALLRWVATDDGAPEAVQAYATQEIATPVAAALEQAGVPGPGARERATLAGSQLVGLAMIRYVFRLEPLAGASVDHLVDVVGPTIQHYLTGPLPAHR